MDTVDTDTELRVLQRRHDTAEPPEASQGTTDVFGTPRFGCRSRGCGCTAYVTQVDAMPPAQREEIEAQFHVLTCQRKSELTLWCTCGHPSWDHTQKCQSASGEGHAEGAGRVPLESVLQQASLTHLRSVLATETLDGLCSEFAAGGRVRFLRTMRERGVASLQDRQALANAVSRESREREAVAAESAAIPGRAAPLSTA